MYATNLRRMFIVTLIIGVAVGYAQADKQQLQENLSRNVKIQLKDATIAEALNKIGRDAEVKIVLSDEAQWKLPYGAATRLSVTLEGPLADSLTEMLNAFFMRYVVGDEEITIYPRKELEHILGRPTTEQLELLKKIYSYRIEVSGGVSEGVFFELIKNSTGPISFFPHYTLQKMFQVLAQMGSDQGSLPTTLAVLLEQVGTTEGMPRWYLTGMDFPNQIPAIRLVEEEDFREAKLDQIVDISFRDERPDVILQRLTGWAGMELVVVRGNSLRMNNEITVNMQNITLRQAIRNIVSTINGEMGIDIGDNEIQIIGPIRIPLARASQTPASVDPKSSGSTSEGYVGKISIPMEGGKYYIEFMLREGDLTEELKKLREEKIKEIIEKTPETEL
jgi:hypothetical protein